MKTEIRRCTLALAKCFTMGAVAAVAVTLSGCIGTNAVTAKVMGFNLRVVDNRYARGGINMLLAPVYALTAVADAIVFNSIEFWAGTNPLNGKPHIFDSKVKTMYDINDDLSPALKEAPLSKLNSSEREVSLVQMKQVNETTLEFYITYTSGEKAVLRGQKLGNIVAYDMDGELLTTTTMDELETFIGPDA